MKINQLRIQYFIEGNSDTYYDLKLTMDPSSAKTVDARFKVIAQKRILHDFKVSAASADRVRSGIGAIKNYYDGTPLESRCIPTTLYRLKIRALHYKLEFIWDADGIDGNPSLFHSLMAIIESLEEIHEVDFSELGMRYKE